MIALDLQGFSMTETNQNSSGQKTVNVAARLAVMADRMPDAIAIAEPLDYGTDGKRRYKTITFAELDRGLDYLYQFLPGVRSDRNLGHYFYGHYYAAQAMFLSGSDRWFRWYPAIREELIASQQEEGYWRGQAGNEYGTAMALIILQMPDRLLPIFQR